MIKKKKVSSAAPFIPDWIFWENRINHTLQRHKQQRTESSSSPPQPLFKSKLNSVLSAGVQASLCFSFLGPETKMLIVHRQATVLSF